jgi:hypothetical protein
MKPWQLQQADRAWRRAKTEKISLEGTQGLNANEHSVFLLEPKCFLLTFLFIGRRGKLRFRPAFCRLIAQIKNTGFFNRL